MIHKLDLLRYSHFLDLILVLDLDEGGGGGGGSGDFFVVGFSGRRWWG